MRSQLAETARQTLAEEVRRMTPEARLAAFLAHNELMAQLRAAGEVRGTPPDPVPTRAG